MDSLQVRLEALEREQAAAKRSLGRWKRAAAVALAGALCLVPLGAQSAPTQSKSMPEQVAALQQQVATLQAALNNEVAARQAGDATLRGQLAPLAAKLEKVSVQEIDGRYSIVIDGANLHLRNGGGTTFTTNGLGNLIVGYSERSTLDLPGFERTGSHNVVVGPEHGWTSFGGVVVGLNSRINGPFASVSGGHFNQASGTLASVSGGEGNLASGELASVSGGLGNTASGLRASVSGGRSVVQPNGLGWSAGGSYAPGTGIGVFHAP